jgi:hypothetical protein
MAERRRFSSAVSVGGGKRKKNKTCTELEPMLKLTSLMTKQAHWTLPNEIERSWGPETPTAVSCVTAEVSTKHDPS